MPIVKETRIITAGTTLVVPSTWNNSNNSITCIGGGAGGNIAFGGGGGARVSNTNVSLAPNATINIAIGAGGSANSRGGDTIFNPTTETITLVGTPNAVNAGTGTLGLPSGLQQNDMVFIISAEDIGTLSIPTGYTSIANTNAGDPSFRISYKFMGSTPDTQASNLGTAADSGYVVFALRGVDPDDPFGRSNTRNSIAISAASSGMPNPPAINTTHINCMTLAIGVLDDDLATSISPPTDYTTINNFSFGTAENGGTIMSAYKIVPTPSTENPSAFTAATGDDNNYGITISLKPITTGDIIAKGGSIPFGGNALSSKGQTKYSGGNGGTNGGTTGGAGGGGAGGTTANGSSGGNGNSGHGGNAGDRGESATIVFDLGSAKTFNAYRWASGDSAAKDPVSWTIEVSNNNINWTTVSSDTNFDEPSNLLRNTYTSAYDIGSTQVFRYVRWVITKVRTSGNQVQASEFVLRNAGVDISMAGTTVTAPASLGSNVASNLVDGSTSTRYCSSATFPTDGGLRGGGGGRGGGAGTGKIGAAGWDNGSDSNYEYAQYGSNYSGGGGGGGGESSDKSGSTFYDANTGGLFGGGGGCAAGITTNDHATDGAGGQGAIILEWSYQSVLNSSGQLSISDVNIALGDPDSNTTSLNDSDVRSLANVAAGISISFSDMYGDFKPVSLVSSSSGYATQPSLPTTRQAGDLAILFYTAGSAKYLSSNKYWQPLGNTYGNILFTNNTGHGRGFWKVLESDTETAPTIEVGGPEQWMMVVFRNASRANAVSKLDNDGGNTLGLPGFTKSNSSKMLVSFVAERGAATITPPTNWTAIATQGDGSVGLFHIIESAYLDSRSYTNGSTITWSNFNITNSQGGIVIELE